MEGRNDYDEEKWKKRKSVVHLIERTRYKSALALFLSYTQICKISTIIQNGE